MLILMRCVAEAVVAKGVRGLAELVPGGAFLYEVAEEALKRLRERKQLGQLRDELLNAANAGSASTRQAAEQVVREVAANAPEEDRVALEMYLTRIPGAVRQSLRRAEDPSGKSVPANVSLDNPADLLARLPAHSTRFRPGLPLPGKPGWELVELLGTGGFGEVWLARNPSLSALKGAVKFGIDAQVRDRLLRHEGAVVNRVMEHGRHPNVVQLLDAHLEGDTPWLMYEYVSGGDLTGVIQALQSLPRGERARWTATALRTLAAAVGHFHRLTPPIVHRDLKPSNILVEPSSPGRARAKVLKVADFGIGGVAAASLAGTRGRTSAGVLGTQLWGSHTPLYASPQQQAGSPPDPRDDVHALGVIGYQMLTGRLDATLGADYARTLRKLEVPEPLIELLGDCAAHDPDHRPVNATRLADRLAQMSAGTANPLPAPAAPTPAPSRQASPARPEEPAVIPLAVGDDGVGRPGRFPAEEDEEGRSGRRPPPGSVRRRSLDPQRKSPPRGRPTPWANLLKGPLGYPMALIAIPGVLLCLGLLSLVLLRSPSVVSPGGPASVVAPVGQASVVAPGGQASPPREIPKFPPGKPFTGARARPTRRPAAAVAKGEQALAFGGLAGRLNHLAFSSEGDRIVAASEEGTVQLFARENGGEVGKWETGVAGHRPAFSPDGSRLAVAAPGGKVLVIDAFTGKTAASLAGFGEGAVLVAFDPDGRWVVAGGDSGRAVAWPATQKDPNPKLLPGETDGRTHAGPVTGVVADPKGRYLATSGGSEVRLWRVGDWSSAVRTLDAGWPVAAVAFSPGGTRVVVGGSRGVKAWDLDKGGGPQANEKDLTEVVHVEYGGTRNHLAGLGRGEVVTFYPNDLNGRTTTLGGHTGRLNTFAFNPSGKYLATGGADKVVYLRDLFWGPGITEKLTGHPAAVVAIAYSPDGSELASGDSAGNLIIWRVPNGAWGLPHEKW